MGFALPSGVVNTDSVYFYADATQTLGPHVKQPTDQTLVFIDYSKISPPITLVSYEFTVDVSSNPALVVSYPQLDPVAKLLSFLVSGGIEGQEYNISVAADYGASTRTDVLVINIPSSGDCACDMINPVPSIYTQLPLGEPTQGYVNTAVRYFWGSAPPNNPGVLDQWYNPDSATLYEWATDGTKYFWQVIMADDLVPDAPSSGLIFGRYNGAWIVEPIQADAPSDGGFYARRNAGWAAVPPSIADAPATSRGYVRYNNSWLQAAIQLDAPNDGGLYARSSASWQQITPPIPDVPNDSTLYARVDANWLPVPVQTDAPPDGQIWGRQNYQWVPVPAASITDDAPTNGTLYGRQNAVWVAAYPASNPDNFQTADDVAANYYPLTNPANYQTGAQVNTTIAPLMPKIGGIFTGGVQFNVGAVFPAVSNFYVGGGTAGQVLSATGTGTNMAWADPGTPEAPMDGVAYARENGAWVPTASGSGLPDAPTDGTAYARKSGVWTNLGHADILDWSATLAPYALTANVPVGSSTTPLMDGSAAVGVGTTWARADHVHPTDTSRYSASNPSGFQTAAQVTAALAPYALASAVPTASNANPAMDGAAAAGSAAAFSRGDHVHPSDTSRLALAGGTMTGPLILAADPTAALGAATMQYVTNAIANVNIDCGTF